jgi:hypothetical protein
MHIKKKSPVLFGFIDFFSHFFSMLFQIAIKIKEGEIVIHPGWVRHGTVEVPWKVFRSSTTLLPPHLMLF